MRRRIGTVTAAVTSTLAALAVALSPSAPAQSVMPPSPPGLPQLENAPVWTPTIPFLPAPPVITFPVIGPDRPAPEYGAVGVVPTPNETVGVAQPVMFAFDRPIRDRAAAEATIGIRTSPPVPGKFYWVSDSEVRWRPLQFWPVNTSVTVWAGGKVQTSFRTGDAVVSTYDDATHLVTVTRNGQVVRTMRASTGRQPWPTSPGVYYTGWRAREVRMDSSTWGLAADAGGYDVTVADGVRLSYGGVFLHSAPWSIADQGVRNVSHGCINVSPEDARWFYDNTRNGDPVVVVGTAGPVFGWDGQADWNY